MFEPESEPEIVALHQNKRPYNLDDDEQSDTETESKSSSNDTEESNSDPSDIEDDSTIATDQSRTYPIVSQQTSCSRRSQRLVKKFQTLRDYNKRKWQDKAQAIDESKATSCQLRVTFSRTEGYAVFSNEPFPFHSLCYLCGSMGSDLIYCNSCCQAYHPACLTESERPTLYPTPESWLCPHCHICCICGLSNDSQLITCSDCNRIFHVKCLKPSKDEPISLNLHHLSWLCPLCIKCDCGEKLISNEENLLAVTKSVTSQQSLMCPTCLDNMKSIRTSKTEKIEKCHLCEKFIEQFVSKPKPLFSLSLIGNQPKPKFSYLLQCHTCQHRFHPYCDGYLNEDVLLMPYLSIKITCSKCEDDQRVNIQKGLINYKIQTVKNIIASIASTLQIIISEENRLNDMKRYLSNLQQLYQSRRQSLNLHAFINDLLIIIQRLLDNLDSRQWQAAIDNCLIHQCPWYKSSNLSSTNKILSSSSINAPAIPSNVFRNHCLASPSMDHTYALNKDRIFFESNVYKSNLLTSSDSLLRYMNSSQGGIDSFENLHRIDTRICQLCQTYADHFSSNISRLLPIRVNQWIHIGCILPAYAKILDQPPYILYDIRETINRCQTKWKCELCQKMGASVQCHVDDCPARFHGQCIDVHYSKFDRTWQEKCNITQGLLPNLTTLCTKHHQTKLEKINTIDLSSAVYVDLSDSLIEFSVSEINISIGSLQIKSLGNYDYLLDPDSNMTIYPNEYRASRLFWSTKNARRKTIYHLHINIEQTYHQDPSNHQTITYPLSTKQAHLEQLYQTCETYFNQFHQKSSTIPLGKISIDTKTLQNLLKNEKSSDLSRFALALVQALQCPSAKLQAPLFNYHLSNTSKGTDLPQLDGTVDDLIESYQQWSSSKFGRTRFRITSDDGYEILSDDLDDAWSTIVHRVRECRDDMNLTHISMTNEELNGHHIFGLTKSLIKTILYYEQTGKIPMKKKIPCKRRCLPNSRLNIYQRKSSQRSRFHWLLNPNRKIEYLLHTFQIDPALAYAREILLEHSSVSLCLYHLHYFSQRVLVVGSSAIHGCGLFTLMDLVEGQMIIEYTGEVVRSCLTDKRERENERKGFGCYMFTVDSMNVIDATHQGNKARFINHHCQPNCFAKTVISNGMKHIIIYALQNISRGSELTYDYSFPEEEIKIPCHCGTKNCRMYLN